MIAVDFCKMALFFYADKPDDYIISMGHWEVTEPDQDDTTRPRFVADMSVTVGEIRRMAAQ